MDTASNELVSLPYVCTPKIRAVSLPSSSIPWSSETSSEIRLLVHKPVKTPRLYKLSSITVLSIPRDSEIVGWHLKSLLLVQVSHTRRGSLATTWLEGVAEYGTGKDQAEAVTDLVISLGEYCKSLEKQEDKLGDSARKELNCLRRLIKRSP